MDNANNIFERKNLDGSVDYVVNVGAFLYNNRIVSLSNIVIPLRQQSFFILPAEKRYYAAVNVYYSVDDGIFIFDTIRKSSTFIDSCDSDALSNLVPIGQFILQQMLSSFEVKKINLYSRMSTFAVTNNFVQGDRGAQGEIGDTGFFGYTGPQGFSGLEGPQGFTGIQGETCMGLPGYTGMQGETGVYCDLDLQLYLKFKNDDINLVDYSPYERDLLWGATGAGVTGIIYTNDDFLVTGIEFIDQGQGSVVVEEGIQDNCHNVQYHGGSSGYRNNKYVGFTGTFQAWVNVDQVPRPDFTIEACIGYTGGKPIWELVTNPSNPDPIVRAFTGAVGYPYRFTSTSLYNPASITWYIEDMIYHANVVMHSFPATGSLSYMIKLSVANYAGSQTKSELLMVV